MPFVARASFAIAILQAVPSGSVANPATVTGGGRPETPANRPGEYESTMEVLGPALAVKILGSIDNGPSTFCLTEAAAARSLEQRLRNTNADMDCHIDRFTVEGEAIDALFRCRSVGGGMTSSIAMTGAIGNEGSTLNITTTVDDPAFAPDMAPMEMKIVTRRIGECSPASRAAAEALERDDTGEE